MMFAELLKALEENRTYSLADLELLLGESRSRIQAEIAFLEAKGYLKPIMQDACTTKTCAGCAGCSRAKRLAEIWEVCKR